MELRFRVNQAEAFRQGVNVPRSIVTVDVDAAAVPEAERNLLADRMNGIDICQGVFEKNGEITASGFWDEKFPGDPESKWKPRLIEAKLPTYEALIKAVREDDEKLRAENGGAFARKK